MIKVRICFPAKIAKEAIELYLPTLPRIGEAVRFLGGEFGDYRVTDWQVFKVVNIVHSIGWESIDSTPETAIDVEVVPVANGHVLA